jgi:hypothetical protein
MDSYFNTSNFWTGFTGLDGYLFWFLIFLKKMRKSNPTSSEKII